MVEVRFLDNMFGWDSYDIDKIVPLLEESLKILPFLLVMWKVSQHRDESFSAWRRVNGLLVVGMTYGFYEHNPFFIPGVGNITGVHRLEWMWLHGSLTAFTGFYVACFPFSVLLHSVDYIILYIDWRAIAGYRYLVRTSFFVSFILLVAYKGIMILTRNKDGENKPLPINANI